MTQAATLSVIIPFAPGESCGATLIETLRHAPWSREIELLLATVADTPLPATIAQAALAPGVRILASGAGRACQMNAAARAARGDWLWFVHADSQVSTAALQALDAFLAANRDVLGYFDLHYAADGPRGAALNAALANLRSRWLGLPFGDQGFVLQRDTFARLGGYDENLPRGEDHALVWRAHAACLPLQRISAALVSSARRYAQAGWARTTAISVARTLAQVWRGQRLASTTPHPGAGSDSSAAP